MTATIMPQDPAARELFDVVRQWPIYDAHSHIDALRPASRNFDEILGYHYYTELAHSAGMPSGLVSPSLDPAERASNLARHLHTIENTVQYSWLVEIARTFFGQGAEAIDAKTIEGLYRKADRPVGDTKWDEEVWRTTNLEAVFLTNEFDDPLEGWDTSKYVPCLRTDDLVLKLHLPSTLERLKRCTNVDVQDYASLRLAIGALFEFFVERGARACAISLPPDFAPEKPGPQKAATPLRRALHGMELRLDEQIEVRQLVFWTLAEFCAEFRLPFDLMIGPIRNVYPAGVAGGRDLFDRRVSLHDYHGLFNHFPQVTFPVSTLSPDAGAELVAYSWIFPNVLPMGHWWYSNIPQFISQDLRARVQAVPQTKLLGYYSDAYKLEFVLPKFNMYRRLLCETLAEEMLRGRGWSLEQTLGLARKILIENPKRVFGRELAGVRGGA